MRVLFATDGSESAEAALTMLEGFGNRRTTELTVLSASAVRGQGTLEGMFSPEAVAHIRSGVEDVVAATKDRLQRSGFRADGRAEEGEPAARILEMISSGSYDLTVVGAGRHSWLGRFLLGSTSMQVLRRSPSSVLVVHQSPAEGENLRVLVAADGSQGARHAAAQFRDLADSAECSVSVLSVAEATAEPPPAVTFPAVAWRPPEAAANQFQQEVEHAMKAAEAAARAEAERFRSAGFRVEKELALGGSPAQVILYECQNGSHDLVVVGSRGLGRLGSALFGSVGDAVARHAPGVFVGRTAPPAESKQAEDEPLGLRYKSWWP
ncbi:MAG: universal stress protein [Actinomycetota bacterium]